MTRLSATETTLQITSVRHVLAVWNGRQLDLVDGGLDGAVSDIAALGGQGDFFGVAEEPGYATSPMEWWPL